MTNQEVVHKKVYIRTFGWTLGALLHDNLTCFEGHI